VGTDANSQKSSNDSTVLEDSKISRTMKSLAEQAYQLSKKYEMEDEANIL